MKQFLLAGIICSVASIGFFSCIKGDHAFHDSHSVTIDTTIASGSLYELNLQRYGDADDVATIKQQAATYTKSEITNAATGFAPVYHFSANTNVKTGLNEQVVIAITEGGNRTHCDTSLVTINFKIQ